MMNIKINVVIVCLILLTVLLSCNIDRDPKIGEVWRYIPEGVNTNPFPETLRLRLYPTIQTLPAGTELAKPLKPALGIGVVMQRLYY